MHHSSITNFPLLEKVWSSSRYCRIVIQFAMHASVLHRSVHMYVFTDVMLPHHDMYV